MDYGINYSQRFSDVLNDLTPEEKLLLDLTETNKALMEKIKELAIKEIATYIKDREAEAKLECDKKARELLL